MDHGHRETQEAMTMTLGKRRSEQQEVWVATTDLPKSEGHVFYRKLNEILAETRLDRGVEQECRPYYHRHLGRPSIPPGACFRMLLVGCFEGIGSPRGIAWRCGDRLSLRVTLQPSAVVGAGSGGSWPVWM
jgi:transposase